LGALDPAVKRRAADILTFSRPDADQRREILGGSLKQVGFSDAQLEAVVAATGTHNGRGYGFTASDLTQRLLPGIVLDAYPDRSVNADRAADIARGMTPTPPFQDDAP